MNSFIKTILIYNILFFSFFTNINAQCESGGHSTHPDDNWISCTTSTNAAGRTGHWIQYDFGAAYNLLTSHFWNYNVVGEVGKGFKEVQIDYSLDGNTWTSFGNFTFGVATGGNDYKGESGPDFGGIQAKFLIITAINNHSADACSGLGELKINVKNCGQLKTGATVQDVTCDAGGAIQLAPEGGISPFTIQWADAGAESYRSDLNPGTYTVSVTDDRGCVTNQDIVVPISKESTTIKTISGLPIPTDTFIHTGIIESAGFIRGTSKVSFQATNSILLLPNFQATVGSDFLAKIIDCAPSTTLSEEILAVSNKTATIPLATLTNKGLPTMEVKVQPNPFWGKTMIELSLKEVQNINVGVFSLLGSEVQILASDKNLSEGIHQFTFDKANLSSGMYIVKVFNKEFSVSKKIVMIGNH